MSQIKFWSMANMKKKKEMLEKKHGGFGQGKIRDMYLGVDGDESEDETETNTSANLYSPNDLTGHVTKLDMLFESAIKNKKIIEGALREARSAFPTISEIKTFVDRYKSFYKDVVNVEDDNANVDGEKIEVEAEEDEGGLKLDDVIRISQIKQKKSIMKNRVSVSVSAPKNQVAWITTRMLMKTRV
ncbi:uncharacterized protein LOC143596465 [Bidens hawaiensis]|uniref:uncharacterized protein LOC143596465 n=1 Tax=Bidens hawaiensis TaxID=980011 RepID=UPI00404A8548